MVLSFSAVALEFKIKGNSLHLSGSFDEQDFDAFHEMMELNEGIDTVILGNSNGGLTMASYPIGRYIKGNNLKTVIEKDAVCVSSCSFVWLAGGEHRRIEDGGSALFHSSYVPTDAINDIIATKCLEENLDEDETVETCVAFTQDDITDGVRMVTRQSIAGTVKYMLEMNAPHNLIEQTLSKGPHEFFAVTDINKVGDINNEELHKLSNKARGGS